jgi:UDP:flavonoid glycosyltransferase YjiC (YdhE family)
VPSVEKRQQLGASVWRCIGRFEWRQRLKKVAASTRPSGAMFVVAVSGMAKADIAPPLLIAALAALRARRA